jgi:hypothetical protein
VDNSNKHDYCDRKVVGRALSGSISHSIALELSHSPVLSTQEDKGDSMDSRREFLQSVSLAGIGAAAVQMTAPLGMLAGAPDGINEDIHIDPNFTSSLQEELILIHDRMKSTGEVRSADIAVTAMAMKLVFRHFDDTGLNAHIERYFLDNKSELRDGPSEAKRAQMEDALRAGGIRDSNQVLEKLFAATREKREMVIGAIRNGGIRKTAENSF